MSKHDSDKKFFELLALNLLKEYLNIDISNFVDSEKPDWVDKKNSIGIEVTRNSEGTKFWADLEKVTLPISDNNIKKFNKRFEKNGGSVIDIETAKVIFGDKYVGSFHFNKNYFYIIPSYNDDFTETNKIIQKKVELLNNIYDKQIRKNRLFVFTPIYTNDEIVKTEIININNIQKNKERKFEIIYICLLHEMYVINLNSNNFQRIIIDKNKFEKISNLTYDEINLLNNKII